MLLQVLGLASGVCLALGPEFPEVAHRGPNLNWSGRGGRSISPLGELLTLVLTFCPFVWCLCVCVCVCALPCMLVLGHYVSLLHSVGTSHLKGHTLM